MMLVADVELRFLYCPSYFMDFGHSRRPNVTYVRYVRVSVSPQLSPESMIDHKK